MAITSAAITTSAVPIYTSSGSNAITCIIICNLNQFNPSNPADQGGLLWLHAVPAGDEISNINLIVNGLPITAGETLSLDQEKLVLDNGDALYAFSDVNFTLVTTISTLAV